MNLRMDKVVGALAGFGSLLIAGSASAGLVASFDLENHPDAAEAPPPYGLRLDNLFLQEGGEGGVTTFSFDTQAGVTLSIFDESQELGDRNGSFLRINISGEVFGGEESGYGVGLYDLNFDYRMHVTEVEDGWVVVSADGSNNGSLTPIFDVEDGRGGGAEYRFWDQFSEGADASARFQNDGHRLDDRVNFVDMIVGRGWLTFNQDNSNSAGTQDFLFIGRNREPGNPIPLPTAAGLGLAGLGVVVSRRRR